MNSVVIPIPGPINRILSYIVRHWRGQLSLGISYWINFAIPMTVDRVLDKFSLLDGHSVVAIVLGLIEIVWLPWALVGIWRAAKPTGWGLAARIIVIWQVLINSYTFIHAFVQAWNGGQP
jgi:hypothetical protein